MSRSQKIISVCYFDFSTLIDTRICQFHQILLLYCYYVNKVFLITKKYLHCQPTEVRTREIEEDVIYLFAHFQK